MPSFSLTPVSAPWFSCLIFVFLTLPISLCFPNTTPLRCPRQTSPSRHCQRLATASLHSSPAPFQPLSRDLRRLAELVYATTTPTSTAVDCRHWALPLPQPRPAILLPAVTTILLPPLLILWNNWVGRWKPKFHLFAIFTCLTINLMFYANLRVKLACYVVGEIDSLVNIIVKDWELGLMVDNWGYLILLKLWPIGWILFSVQQWKIDGIILKLWFLWVNFSYENEHWSKLLHS